MRNEVLWGNQSTCCATATMMIVQVDYYQLLITHVWHVCQANVKQSVSSQRQTKRDLLCLSPHIQVNWISGCPRDPDFVFLVHFGFDLWLPQRSQKCSGCPRVPSFISCLTLILVAQVSHFILMFRIQNINHMRREQAYVEHALVSIMLYPYDLNWHTKFYRKSSTEDLVLPFDCCLELL